MARFRALLVGICLIAFVAPLIGGCGNPPEQKAPDPVTPQDTKMRRDKSGD